MVSQRSWRARGEGRSQPQRTGGGKLRAIPPKGTMNLRRVPHRLVKVEVSRQPRWSADESQSAGRSRPFFPRWNEATGWPGQSQLGLIKYNQNLKSWAPMLRWSGQNRAHLCAVRGFTHAWNRHTLFQWLRWISKLNHLLSTMENKPPPMSMLWPTSAPKS